MRPQIQKLRPHLQKVVEDSLLNVTQASFDMSKPEVLNSEQGNARITLSEVLEYLDSIN